CSDGFYGENCGRRCGHCKAFGCNKTNGECINTLCTAGWTGQKCDRKCQDDSYGENCTYHCGNCKWAGCDNINGYCPHKRCSIGWKGLKCDIPCPAGSYGENCERRCGHCKAFGCNRTSGECINTLCTAGWTGQKCDRECQYNSYGENCTNHCGNCKWAGCDNINGHCLYKQCSIGWKGQKCDTPCPDGSYGEGCAKRCGHCKDPGCNKTNGDCINASCSAGWKGQKCDRACASGHYGENCARLCGHCKDFGCNRTNGNCLTTLCSAGWKGQKCDKACAIHSYGENCAHQCGNCIQSTCDRINGNCADNECSAGWRGQRCDTECDRGTYGINCSKYCNNCVNESCDHLNGICQISGSCKAGYYGPQCSEVCVSGRFGTNCIDTCSGCLNEDCEPFSGNCTQDGCRNGYTGYRCHLRGTASLNNGESKSTIVGGIIGAILAVIAISLIGIFIFRKRTKGLSTPKRDTHFRNDVKESCNPELENISSTNNMYANGTLPVNLYRNTELKDTSNVYSNTEANNAFSEYNIAVGNLPSIATIKRKNNAFKREYSMLPKGSNFPHLEGEREENRHKNRFLTTFPYDHSRVKLEMYDDSTDYINANYIKNYSKDKAYIATQGPKKITLSDFWQMIWQENVDTIVMVTKLMEGEKKKCEQYWPESTYKQLVIDKFTLKSLVEKENTIYTYRCIQLSCKNTNRTVHHFHFTKWPDHDVPDKTDLVNFYRKVKSTPTNLSGPMVVHCSAGIGRTGTFLALDALYEHGKTTGFVNIMEYTHMMRQDRMNMIQTVEQYATVYDVLVEAFTVPQYAIPRQDFLNMLDSRLIEREYQKLQDLKPVTEANKFQAGKRKENVPKNAVQIILPHDYYRPYLMSYGRSSNDYINAVKIPSFTDGTNIFVTQYPLLNTIGDFWSLVYDNDCRTIVILEEINEDVPVIPSDSDHKISNDNFIISRNSQNVSLQDGVKVSLRHKNKKEERPITVFVYNDWEDNNPIPNSTKTMVDFLEIVSTTTRADHESIVVICRDGCTRSGIFVTLKLVLEKMETDDEVDIFQVSRRIQTRRPQFLSTIEQYEFCYSAVKELLSRESVYANA
ncbi:Hypothetical predicted protein, partial [Mytilus galloprovincialis]